MWFVDLLRETGLATATAAAAQAVGVPGKGIVLRWLTGPPGWRHSESPAGRRRGATVNRPYCAAEDAVSPGLLDEPESVRALRGLESRAAVELGEQVADVHVDGALAEKEPRRDLPVGETFGREPEHLHLAA